MATLTLGSRSYRVNLLDAVDRAIIADLLEENGREVEAALLRGGQPVHAENGQIQPANALVIAHLFAELATITEGDADRRAEECRDFAEQLEEILHTEGVQAAIEYYVHGDDTPSHVTLAGTDPREWFEQLEHQALDWEQTARALEDSLGVVGAGQKAVRKARKGNWHAALHAAERACDLEREHGGGGMWERLRDEIRRQMGME